MTTTNRLLLTAICTAIMVLVLTLIFSEAHSNERMSDDALSVLTPKHAVPSHDAMIEAPAASWGVVVCNVPNIWILLKDARFYRLDKDHLPASPQDMQVLLDWLNQGPSDIIKVPCATSL